MGLEHPCMDLENDNVIVSLINPKPENNIVDLQWCVSQRKPRYSFKVNTTSFCI